MRQLAKAQVLILDLEIVEDRYEATSIVITSQRSPEHWHAVIGDETIADPMLDRIVHNAHRTRLGGPSIRKTKNGLSKDDPQAKSDSQTGRPNVASL